jgi:Protein of unknwon function (DUF3310)
MPSDAVNSPAHYQGKGFECIDAIEIFNYGYHLGNVFKYLIRHKKKNGLEDVKKALWYLERFYANPTAKCNQIENWKYNFYPDPKQYHQVSKAFNINSPDNNPSLNLVLSELIYLSVKCSTVELLNELLGIMTSALKTYINEYGI